MSTESLRRKGARRKADVPVHVLTALAEGTCETVNLMEWLSLDMAALARNIARECDEPRRTALLDAAGRLHGQGVLGRLATMGSAIAAVEPAHDAPWRSGLAVHRSDIVRQWACYAVNDERVAAPFEERLARTLPFAADLNMSVREAAWMAFRPHIVARLPLALEALTAVATSHDENVRRFAVEVTRPRSVWGAHIKMLKQRPEAAGALLDKVSRDPARYVRLAVANWLNDASKTRPDWVRETCARWSEGADARGTAMLRRAMRTIDGRTAGVLPAQAALCPF